VPVQHSFDYAIIRVTPRLDRGETINAGVVLFCRTRRFLAAPTQCDAVRLHMLDHNCDIASVAEHLAVFSGVARGDHAYGPIARLPIAERFHWLVAPRSTIITTTPVHCGVCDDPDATVQTLFQKLVL
jgi:hypothetical protein